MRQLQITKVLPTTKVQLLFLTQIKRLAEKMLTFISLYHLATFSAG